MNRLTKWFLRFVLAGAVAAPFLTIGLRAGTGLDLFGGVCAGFAKNCLLFGSEGVESGLGDDGGTNEGDVIEL